MFALLVSMTTLMFWSNYDGHVLRQQAPAGQSLYLYSKLTGVIALALLCWQVVMALLGGAGILPKPLRAGRRTHIVLGAALICCIALHVGLFTLASMNRTGQLSLLGLLPTFTGGYYDVARSLGSTALLLLIVSVTMSTLGKRISRYWRTWHLLVVPVIVLVFIHAYLIGSEVRSELFEPLYWGMVALFVSALITRLLAGLFK